MISRGRAALWLALVVLSLATIGAGSTFAAKGERKGGAKKDDSAGSGAPIATVKGDKIKMAKAKVANRVTRITDAPADQVGADGQPASGAPAWSDMASVHVAPIRVPPKLLGKVDDDFPRGAVGAFYGKDADWSAKDRAVFVALELAERRPSRSVVQQVEIGLDGNAAVPVRVDHAGDVRAGVERFSLSGLFSDGSESSGTTDLSGWQPGEPIDYYNAPSRVFGFYDQGRKSYFIVMPIERDTETVAVTLRTMTDSGEVIDRLELPDGGHLVTLTDPARGFDAKKSAAAKAGTAPLGCRALETFSAASGTAELSDPAATVIRYSVGVDPSLDASEADAVLRALDELDETVPVTMTPVGSTGGEPRMVGARLTRAPALGAVTLTMEVPAGQWSFGAAEGADLLTPGGESLVDHASLTGQAGVLTGDGLDGFAAGDPDCARWDLRADACELVPGDGMAGLVGLDDASIEQTSVARADGATWCVGVIPATGEPQYIARFGTTYERRGQRAGADPACRAHPIDVGAEGVNIDCGELGYENHSFLVVPDSTAARDPDGGVAVSVDVLVDPDKPYGERYDTAAALDILSGVAATLARSARPAGSAALDAPAPADDA